MVSFVSALQIRLDGELVPQKLTDNILQVCVEESLHLPTMFTIVLHNAHRPGSLDDEPWEFESWFKFGQPVEISFAVNDSDDVEGSESNVTTIVIGEITAIESHMSYEAQAPIIVRGYDYSHRLHRGRHCRSFQNMTDSDIVRAIAKEVQIPCGEIDETLGPYGYDDINNASGYVFQENQTNMEFLSARAARHGFELFVENDQLHFRNPTIKDRITLNWLKELSSFRVRMTNAQQVSTVEVRGWDYARKQVIKSTCKLAETAPQSAQHIPQDHKEEKRAYRLTNNQYGGSGHTEYKTQSLPKNPQVTVVNQPIFSEEEAESLARTLAEELEGQFVQADACASGDVRIRPGRSIELKDINKYSGSYYVTETRHVYEDGRYRTEFSVRGLRTGDLLSTIAPKNALSPAQTHLVGVVTDNRDPKGWGRVRVKLPSLSEEHNSYWARMVQAGAGANRGFDCLPEIDDEVLVAFEHGNIHRPYILGGVWNGKDQPPESVNHSVVADGSDAGTVRLRTLKTRVGHTFQLSEEDPNSSDESASKGSKRLESGAELFGKDSADSLKGIHLKTEQGHRIDLCDSDKYAVNCLRLQSAGAHHISLSDSDSHPGIALHTEVGQSIGLIDRDLSEQSQVNINTPGNIVINGGADAIRSVDNTAKHQLSLLGKEANNLHKRKTYMSLLRNKITTQSSVVETSSAHINQLATDSLTLATGDSSVVQVTPSSLSLSAADMNIQAISGAINIRASQVNIRSATSITISAPNIAITGVVNITGGLIVNGRAVKLGNIVSPL